MQNNPGLIFDMTLALLYLTSWREGKGDDAMRRSWKGYDFDILSDLDEQGFIYGSRGSKPVDLTEDGIAKAQGILAALSDGTLDSLEELKSSRLGGSIAPLPRKAYKLSMRLKDVEPRCSRMVYVPADHSFLDLHVIIQELFGWTDQHLYDFSFKDRNGKRRYIREKPLDDGPFGDPFDEVDEPLLAGETSLDAIFGERRTVTYSYDYGDGWEIVVEKREESDNYDSPDPRFYNGQGSAPPEDVGGPGGFERFLAIIEDKDHPEHQDAVEWGEMQGFEYFSPNVICDRLSEWRESKEMHLYDRQMR